MQQLKDSIIIIESPNKIKKIQSLTGAKVLATAGHFLELKDIEVSKNFAPIFDYMETKKKNIAYYINSCKDKKVYIATDPDREGYGIGYMFYHKIKNLAKEVYRAEFHEITESGITKGLKEAVLFAQTNKKYYEAFLGRRVSDMFIGYSLSPYISKMLNIKALSAGRVQTPALGLIVQREEAINNFNSLSAEEKKSYALNSNIFLFGKEYTLKHIKDSKEFKFENKEEAQKELDKLKEAQSAVLTSIEKKESKEAPPKPFSTSKLLKAGSKALNISTKEVQNIAQKLFEAGLITYIRTDCEFISQEYLKEHQKFYEPIYNDIYEYTTYSAGKNSQAEAHEAIRITHPHRFEDLNNICEKEGIKSENEKKLYELIFKNTICSQCKSAIYENTTLTFNIRLTSFVLKFKNLKEAGYLDAFKKDAQKDSEDKDEESIERINTDRLQINDLFDIKNIFIKEIAKTPPKRYVESDFIEVLEKNGIGRPSTYATYLPTLQNKEYISIDGKKREITPTPRGTEVVNFFKNNVHKWILDIEFTKKMEEKLDDITSNKASYLEFMQELEEKLGSEVGKFGNKKDEDKDKKTSKRIPPSSKQIDFVKAIASRLKLPLPKDLEKDCYVAKDFIDKHIAEFNKAKKQENQKK